MAFHLSVNAPFKVAGTPAGWTFETDNFTYIDWLVTDSPPPFTNNLSPGSSLTGFVLQSLSPISDSLGYALVPWDVSNKICQVAYQSTIAVPTVTNLNATLTQISVFATAGVRLTVPGFPSFSYVVESSTNLSDWTAVTTNSAPFTLSDTNTLQAPAAFFRSWFFTDPASWPVLAD